MLRSFVMAMGITLCLSLISCDLFKTRTPEEPSQQSSNYVPPTDVSLVLQNMINAFQDGNAVNYVKSFSDASFNFVPSTNAKNKYGGIDWTAWNKTQEQQCFEKIINHFSNNSRVVLAFDSYTPTYNNNICQVETAYHLTLPVEAGVVKKFNGQVQYTLTQVSGLWYINQWVDVAVNVSDSTWSDLKGIAYSQW